MQSEVDWRCFARRTRTAFGRGIVPIVLFWGGVSVLIYASPDCLNCAAPATADDGLFVVVQQLVLRCFPVAPLGDFGVLVSAGNDTLVLGGAALVWGALGYRADSRFGHRFVDRYRSNPLSSATPGGGGRGTLKRAGEPFIKKGFRREKK